MKKVLCLVLAALLLLGLCACKQQEAQTAKPQFQVGYGRADITPSVSVPLSGYGNALTRMSEGFYNKLYASCVAMRDENGNTVLLLSVDITTSGELMVGEARTAAAKATGVAEEQIMVSATHTHSAPSYSSDHMNVGTAKKQFKDGVVAAAKAAVEDLAPAAVQISTTQTENLNFVRHYLMNDGTYAGDNYGSFTSGIKAHATEADSEMQLIRYVREGDKKDVLMVNWQAHPKVSSTGDTDNGKATRNLLSADFVGSCREYVESQVDCHFIYFQGAAGNLNARSGMAGKTATTDCKEYGKLLGDFVIGGLEAMTEVAPGAVRVKKETYTAPVDKSDSDLVPKAKEIASYWSRTNDRSGSIQMGEPYGIHSPYHANAIVARAQSGENLSMDVYAISAGGISFVTAPYEMFDTNGMYIKDNTPFDMTFILCYANDHNSYIASAEAFDYGCYEADIRRYAKGAAEELAELYVSMLKDLKG